MITIFMLFLLPHHPHQCSDVFSRVKWLFLPCIHIARLCKMLVHQKETGTATSSCYTRAGLPSPLDHQFLLRLGPVLVHRRLYLWLPHS